MKLQSDPTIIYGLVGGKGTLGRPIKASEIQQPSPYNTYVIEGLPPGPIANPGREASIEVQQGLQVVGDERLLKSMLKRVLENAWRFSATRPQVEISVTGERLADGLRLWIRDRGIGFDMAYADKLFIPFQRLHGAEDGAGSGIGLTIAEQIAERHNGYIRGDAVVGEGAIFEIELADLSTGETT